MGDCAQAAGGAGEPSQCGEGSGDGHEKIMGILTFAVWEQPGVGSNRGDVWGMEFPGRLLFGVAADCLQPAENGISQASSASETPTHTLSMEK